jgi:hypothetical protein
MRKYNSGDQWLLVALASGFLGCHDSASSVLPDSAVDVAHGPLDTSDLRVEPSGEPDAFPAAAEVGSLDESSPDAGTMTDVSDSPDLHVMDAAPEGVEVPPQVGPVDQSGIPEHCRVMSDLPMPAGIKLKIKNNGYRWLYVRRTCMQVRYQVSSCAAGYLDKLGEDSDCGCVPREPRCEVCPSTSEKLDLTQWWPITWPSRRPGADGVTCAPPEMLRPGRYRVTVVAYDSAADAAMGVNGQVASTDFGVPGPMQIDGYIWVTVSLPPPTPDAGSAD